MRGKGTETLKGAEAERRGWGGEEKDRKGERVEGRPAGNTWEHREKEGERRKEERKGWDSEFIFVKGCCCHCLARSVAQAAQAAQAAHAAVDESCC